MRLAQVQRQDALQPADVFPRAERNATVTVTVTVTEVEQRIAHELARPVVRELPASLGEHKVRAERGESRAFGGGVGGGLAAPGGVDGLVLEEEEDVLVRRGGGCAALLELQGVDGLLQLKGAEVRQWPRKVMIEYR